MIVSKSCLDDNTDYTGDTLQNPVTTSDANECQLKCEQAQGCNYFSFQKSTSQCLFRKTQGTTKPNQPDFISGPMKCAGGYCFEFSTDYWGNDIRDFFQATAWGCQKSCQQEQRCQAWTFSKSQSNCWLKTKGTNKKEGNYDLISGPKNCCIEDGIDYYGSDLKGAVRTVNTPLKCLRACAEYKKKKQRLVEPMPGMGCKNMCSFHVSFILKIFFQFGKIIGSTVHTGHSSKVQIDAT